MKFFSFFSSLKRNSVLAAKTKKEDVCFPLPEERFLEMMGLVEDRVIRERAPSLTGKIVLEIAPRLASLSAMLKEKGAKAAAVLGGPQEKEKTSAAVSGAQFILSHWEKIPFLDDSLDVVLVRSAFAKSDLGRFLQEASRVVKPSGMLMVTDFHPFSVAVQKEHRTSPASEEGMAPGFERYYKFFRESKLRIEGIGETFYDGSLRKFFSSSSEKEAFLNLKKTPLGIFFLLKKEKGKGEP